MPFHQEDYLLKYKTVFFKGQIIIKKERHNKNLNKLSAVMNTWFPVNVLDPSRWSCREKKQCNFTSTRHKIYKACFFLMECALYVYLIVLSWNPSTALVLLINGGLVHLFLQGLARTLRIMLHSPLLLHRF